VTVLVTGARGNVGREVVQQLLKLGLQVRAASSTQASGPSLGVESVALDFYRPETFAPAVAGCQALFLVRPPAISKVKQTLNRFLDVAVAQGVQHVVFLSVAGAEDNTFIPHRKVEDHLRGLQVSWTLLRPGFFASNLGDAYRFDLVNDSRLYLPAGAGKVAFIDSRDIAEVAALALTHPAAHAGKAHWLTGPEALGFDAVAQLLSARLGRPVRYQPASMFGYAWHNMLRRRLPAAQVAVQLVLHVGLRRGAAEPVSDTVERLLGRPAGPLSAYIEDHLPLWARPAIGALA
jgi:uncharacterized protein YbjT (DUF2867 family)